jgi:hypothetical protein
MMLPMARDRIQQAPDLFSTPSVRETSAAPAKQVSPAQEQRHALPNDLANAVKHLIDGELDALLAACLDEAKRRGRLPVRDQAPKGSSPTGKSSHRQRAEASTVTLRRGQVNAVRAAFKAGVKPSLIARQFGISQSDVRKVLASEPVSGTRA